jgi:RNA polymerase sigma-70 factor, ECF subfamily
MAVAGDESTQGHARAHALYDRYYLNIYRYALSQLRSAQDAEDAAQNTFLRAFAAMQKGVVPENEAAWLFKIAHNVCASAKLAWLRRRRVETPRDLQLLAVEPEAVQPPREELDGLDDALANMPPRLREAFLLREWQGLSYAEIAERLDTSRSAVETLIFRARRHLATELQRVQTLWLGPLANWLRGFFGTGGEAVLRAAGVVVLAAGVTAAATVPATHDRPARTGPQPVRAGGAPEGALLGADGQRVRRHGTAAAPRRQAAPGQPFDVPATHRAKADDELNTQAGARTTVSAPTSTTTASAAPRQSGPVAQLVQGATTATTPVLPAVTVPSATVPTVSVPAATVPSATVPSATVPSLTTPVVTTPTVTTPTVTTPPLP